MNQDWQGALVRRLLLLLAGCLLIGLITGEYAWALVLGLGGYLAWTLWQIRRLQLWLKRDQPDDPPPDSHGIWGEIFDSLYQLQRRDIHLRGQLQSVIDRVQGSTTALKDAVIMLDSDANLEWWNPAAERLLGLKKPQDSGHAVTNLVRHPSFKEYFESGRHDDPLELPSPVSDRLWLQITITRYGNSEYLMVVRDITRLHQLEQMRKDFVANVSHELRTPLAEVRLRLHTAIAQATQRSSSTDTAEPACVPLADVQNALQSLETLSHRTERLLQLSRAEGGDRAHFAPVNLVHLAEQVAQEFWQNSQDAQKRLDCITPPTQDAVWVSGDIDSLAIALRNLIDNALKHSTADVIVEVQGTPHPALIVTDSGTGLGAAEIERILERHVRFDRQRIGYGLGMSIIQTIAQKHHAQLTLISPPSTLPHGLQARIVFQPANTNL